MITSLTGEGSAEFSQAAAGFNARVALQNAQGGVNGHQRYMIAQKSGFVAASSQPFCGTDIPGTATATATG